MAAKSVKFCRPPFRQDTLRPPILPWYLLAMRMKAGVGETFTLVLPKEATVAEDNVIDFIARAFAIETMPFLRRLLSLSEIEMCACAEWEKCQVESEKWKVK